MKGIKVRDDMMEHMHRSRYNKLKKKLRVKVVLQVRTSVTTQIERHVDDPVYSHIHTQAAGGPRL